MSDLSRAKEVAQVIRTFAHYCGHVALEAADLIEQQQARIAEDEKHLSCLLDEIDDLKNDRSDALALVDELTATVARLRSGIMSNCYDDPSTAGKRLIELVEVTPETNLNAVKREAVTKFVRQSAEEITRLYGWEGAVIEAEVVIAGMWMTLEQQCPRKQPSNEPTKDTNQ